MAVGTAATRYRITNERGETIERNGTEEEITAWLSKKQNPDSYKFEPIGGGEEESPDLTMAAMEESQSSQAPDKQEESWGHKAAEFAAPLTMATIENTKNMPDDYSGWGLAKKAAIGLAGAAEAGMTFLPGGKVVGNAAMRVGGKYIPKAMAAGEKVVDKAGNFIRTISGATPEALDKAGKYARNAVESGAEAGVYDSSVKAAEGADSYVPDWTAIAGAAGVGGFLGGHTDINTQKTKIKADAKAKKVESTIFNAEDAAKKEFAKIDNQVKGAASKSAKNINFAERNTGLKGDEAVHKIIEDNIKHGETVPEAVGRIKNNLKEADALHDEFMKDYNHLKIDKTISQISDELMDTVRKTVGLGSEQSRNVARAFKNMFNEDLAELAEKKLLAQGKTYKGYIDKYLRPNGKLVDGMWEGKLDMGRVKAILGDNLTLGEMDHIKRGMWEKTGMFQRYATSMKNAGEKNMASFEGGHAIRTFFKNLNENERELLGRMGGLAGDDLNDLGYKYLHGLEKQEILSGFLADKYMRLNKERSKYIGIRDILDDANDALSRHNMAHIPYYSKSEWDRLAQEAGQRELYSKLPIEEIIQTLNPYTQNRGALALNSLATQQVGGHGGKVLGNSLGLTPPKQ